MGKDYYQILNLRYNATDQQIRSAYKTLAMKYHPDKNPNDRQRAKQKFTELAQAYQVLSDHQKRAEYDVIRQNQSKSESSRKSRNQYTWKNPQFDPKFDHFKNMPQHIKNFGMKGYKDIHFPVFDTSDWFQQQFGSFSFEQAEDIFEKVFSKYENQMKKLQNEKNHVGEIAYNRSQNQIESSMQKNPQIDTYRPKNGTLINEKEIQRNGKKICVRKYNIVQNGKSHTQIHQSVIGYF